MRRRELRAVARFALPCRSLGLRANLRKSMRELEETNDGGRYNIQ